jgi:hypothetical protein
VVLEVYLLVDLRHGRLPHHVVRAVRHGGWLVGALGPRTSVAAAEGTG